MPKHNNPPVLFLEKLIFYTYCTSEGLVPSQISFDSFQNLESAEGPFSKVRALGLFFHACPTRQLRACIHECRCDANMVKHKLAVCPLLVVQQRVPLMPRAVTTPPPPIDRSLLSIVMSPPVIFSCNLWPLMSVPLFWLRLSTLLVTMNFSRAYRFVFHGVY